MFIVSNGHQLHNDAETYGNIHTVGDGTVLAHELQQERLRLESRCSLIFKGED